MATVKAARYSRLKRFAVLFVCMSCSVWAGMAYERNAFVWYFVLLFISSLFAASILFEARKSH